MKCLTRYWNLQILQMKKTYEFIVPRNVLCVFCFSFLDLLRKRPITCNLLVQEQFWFFNNCFSRTPPSKSQAVAAAVNRPLPHYRLGDLGIVPRSHPKLGERPRATSPLAPISKKTRSIGVQTVSAQKVSGAPSFLGSYLCFGTFCCYGPKNERAPPLSGWSCLEKWETWFQIFTN